MRSQFCPSCGGKNEYSYQPPKFCNSCGKPFAQASIGKTSPSSTNSQPIRTIKKPSRPLAEDETDIDYVPSVAKFEVDIDVPHDNIHKMSDLLNEEKREG